MKRCKLCKHRIWFWEFCITDKNPNREDWYFHLVKYRDCYNTYINALIHFDMKFLKKMMDE